MAGKSVIVNGVRLGVEQWGENFPMQPTLVLLHGFTGSARTWAIHAQTYAAAGLRVIALDMLGHGASDVPDDPARYSIEHCRDDILAALDVLGVPAGSAILLGYSMGGRIALHTAFSGFCRGLILESASPGIADETERAARRASDAALAARIEREGVPAFVEYWENLPLFASQRALPDAVQSAVRAQRLHNHARGLANSLRGVGTGSQPALHDRLPRLTSPTLLIAGALDAKYAAIAREMAQVIPHSEVRIVPGAGHTVHLEQPQVFDTLVIKFCLKDEVSQP
jgi:2-succinyl-6-hydroxy-2,4-cyclohexadiene-1-carboxylate synthase